MSEQSPRPPCAGEPGRLPVTGEPVFRVILRQGREKAARNRHPWVFSGAVDRFEGDGVPQPGELADLVDYRGEFLARGYANPRSQIVFRTLSLKREPIDAAFLARRVESALALRRRLEPATADACRILHGEGDLLPGVVVDRYGSYLVCQIGAAGMERMREDLLDVLEAALKPAGIWERSEGGARREEGLAVRSGLLRGSEPPPRVNITENGVRYSVDLRAGHKTGFYLDQRPARALVQGLARGLDVLDVCAYSGAFAVAAAVAGAASVTAVEASAESLALVPEHLACNGLDPAAVRCERADAFAWLRRERSDYDLIVVDPPPFARKKSEVQGALRGYKDLNLHAMLRLRPGGLLLTSSCSQHVDAWTFQQVLFGAAKDAGRAIQIVRRLGQPSDHPVSLHHPEGEYLKVLLLHAIS